MDLDTFFVSVERLIDSRLNDRPVLIGGTSDRGVVAACSYEARRFGVHSAMPMKMAKQLCPEAVVLRGNSGVYSKYSKLVTEIIKEQVPLYEKTSVDEFYLDLTGMDRFFGTHKFAVELRERIIRESGLPISLGSLSTRRFPRSLQVKQSRIIKYVLTRVLRSLFWLRFQLRKYRWWEIRPIEHFVIWE